jgi:hypothetical protein
MAQTTITITADHAIPLPENYNYTNLNGGTLYYGNDPTVSSTNNIGSVTTGGSLVRRVNGYGIASAATTILMTDAAAGHETTPQKGLLHSARSDLAASSGAATYLLNTSNNSVASAATQTAVTGAGQFLFYWSAQQLTSTGIPRMSLRGAVATNNVAPGTITFTFGLYPVTLSSTTTTVFTTGTVVAGSTAAIANPAQATVTTVTSGDFAPPADGLYAVACVTNATTAATTITHLIGELSMRSV